MRTAAGWVAGAGLALAVTAAAAVLLGGGGRADPDADPDADPVARGRAVYAAWCAECHGARLEGQPDWRSRKPDGRLPAPPHDASGHTWHHSDADLFTIIKQGVGAFAPPGYESDMPAFGGVLSDAEIRAVLAFIRSSWPEDIRRRQAAISRRAAE